MSWSRWSPPISSRRSAVVEDRVGGRVSGPVADLESAIAQLESLTVTQNTVDRRVRPPAAERLRDRPQGACRLGRDAVALHQLDGVGVVGLGLLAVALDERLRHLAGSDLGTRSAADDVDEAEVVDVLMGEDHELEVGDRVAQGGQPALELVEGGAGVGTRVDEGQRLVLDQVDVDPPDRERRGEGEAVDPRRGRRGEGVLGGRRRAGARSAAQDRIRPSTSSRRSFMSWVETSDSRLRRRRGSVLEGRTLKCQSSKSTETPSSQPISAPACS